MIKCLCIAPEGLVFLGKHPCKRMKLEPQLAFHLRFSLRLASNLSTKATFLSAYPHQTTTRDHSQQCTQLNDRQGGSLSPRSKTCFYEGGVKVEIPRNTAKDMVTYVHRTRDHSSTRKAPGVVNPFTEACNGSDRRSPVVLKQVMTDGPRYSEVIGTSYCF